MKLSMHEPTHRDGRTFVLRSGEYVVACLLRGEPDSRGFAGNFRYTNECLYRARVHELEPETRSSDVTVSKTRNGDDDTG